MRLTHALKRENAMMSQDQAWRAGVIRATLEKHVTSILMSARASRVILEQPVLMGYQTSHVNALMPGEELCVIMV